jgi:putative transposase
VKPRLRRQLARWVEETWPVSERRAARLVKVPRSTVRYRSRKGSQEALMRRLKELAAVHVRFGYRRLTVLLRREGWKVNAKRVYRIYAAEGMQVRTKVRKKIARRQRLPAPPASEPNQCWAMDFVSDPLGDGTSFRILAVVDLFTRECVTLLADRPLSGAKVAAELSRVCAERGVLPASITSDNGSEFTGRAMEAWAMEHGVRLDFIRPGRPTENGFAESFNGRLRDECLRVSWFPTLAEARRRLAAWRAHYNRQRPHSSLHDQTPAEFAARHGFRETGRFALVEDQRAGSASGQGFPAAAKAALDRLLRLPQNGSYEGQAPEPKPSQTGVGYWSLQRLWKARQTGTGGVSPGRVSSFPW